MDAQENTPVQNDTAPDTTTQEAVENKPVENAEPAGTLAGNAGGHAEEKPADPVVYDFSPSIPEGVELDRQAAAEFGDIARGLSLNNEQANTLAKYGMTYAQNMVKAYEAQQIEQQEAKAESTSCAGKNILYTVLFILCLLSVADVVPKWAAAVLVAICVLVSDRKIFCNIDFMLLLTFTAFFIFTGNIARLESVDSFLKRITGENEFNVSLAFSQLISNVPATLLLHPFARNTKELLLGVDIGGLGTPVASLASLISLKLYTQEKGGTGKFLAVFTLMNIIFLVALCAMKAILK